MKNVAVCDIYETTKNVRRFRVLVVPVKDENQPDLIDIEPKPVRDVTVDLSEQAAKRLNHFIDRGVTPPTGRRKRQSFIAPGTEGTEVHDGNSNIDDD